MSVLFFVAKINISLEIKHILIVNINFHCVFYTLRNSKYIHKIQLYNSLYYNFTNCFIYYFISLANDNNEALAIIYLCIFFF